MAVKFKYGQVVFLVTDEYQQERIVTAHTVRGKQVTYELSCGSNTPSWHSDVEISPVRKSVEVLGFNGKKQ